MGKPSTSDGIIVCFSWEENFKKIEKFKEIKLDWHVVTFSSSQTGPYMAALPLYAMQIDARQIVCHNCYLFLTSMAC